MIYLICFVTSSIFLFFSEKTKGLAHWVNVGIGILIPAILAGLRSYSVGTDINLYARQVFASALESSSVLWMKQWNDTFGVEYGYLLLNHIIVHFTDNIAWQFFFVELFILLFIYKAFSYVKKNISTDISISYMFLLYYFLMYNESLNLMRQSMAVALILYGFRFVYEKKLIKYLMLILVAMQFHITALQAIIIYPLYILIYEKRKYQFKYPLFLISLLSGVVLGRVIGVITNTGVFGNKFLKYFRGGYDSQFSLNQVVIRLPFILLFWYMAKKQHRKRQYNNFMITVFLLDLAFAELRGIDVTLYRLSLYFSAFKCISYPQILFVFQNKYRKLINVLFLLFILILWYYQTVLMNNGQTYPYKLNQYT